MNTVHDFQSDNNFFISNYSTLLDLYFGKNIVIADSRVLYVAESGRDAAMWSDKFKLSGKCSILEVSPKTYEELTEGIRI